MSAINVSKLKKLVTNFTEELASILDEGGLNTALKKAWKEEANRSIQDLEAAPATLSSKTKGELILLSNVAEVVASSLNHGVESSLDVENEEEFYGGEEGSVPIIVVRGPPGTEPVLVDDPELFTDAQFFKGRYDDFESVVYSRISASSGAGLSNGHTPSPAQVLSIPSKDIPKFRAEVYTTPTRSRRVLRSQRALPANSMVASDPPSPVSSLSSNSSDGSSYNPLLSSLRPAAGSVRRSQRVRKLCKEESDSTSRENSPSVLSGHKRNMRAPPPLLDMSHDSHNFDAVSHDQDELSHDQELLHEHTDGSHDVKNSEDSSGSTNLGDSPMAVSASLVENISNSPLSPQELTSVPETPTRTIPNVSMEEYFSAQEEVDEETTQEEQSHDDKKEKLVELAPSSETASSQAGPGEEFDMQYNADPGGSIRSDSGEDMIATNISIKTDAGNDDNGLFVGQASSDDSDIEQAGPSNVTKVKKERDDNSKLSRSLISPIATSDVEQGGSGFEKDPRRSRQKQHSIQLPPLSASFSASPVNKSLLNNKKMLLRIDRIPPEELATLKPPPVSIKSSPAHSHKENSSAEGTPLQEFMPDMAEDCGGDQLGNSHTQEDLRVPDSAPLESSEETEKVRPSQDEKRSRLKRRKGKSRAEFKVKSEPISQRYVEDSSSGSCTRMSSSPDDITFSDVAANAIRDSPQSESPSPVTFSDDAIASSSDSDKDSQSGPSQKPGRKMKNLLTATRLLSNSRSRSSSVASNPRTPLNLPPTQLGDEDEDFDEKSPFFLSSLARTTPRNSTPLKKTRRKKVLVSISSSDEDEKVVAESGKKTRKVGFKVKEEGSVKKEPGVKKGGNSENGVVKKEHSRKSLFFGDSDIFTFDSDEDSIVNRGGGGAERRDTARVKEEKDRLIDNWIDHLDDDDNNDDIGEGIANMAAMEDDVQHVPSLNSSDSETPAPSRRDRIGIKSEGESSKEARVVKVKMESTQDSPSKPKPPALKKPLSQEESLSKAEAASPLGLSPLEVNIALKSPLKLGKHVKAPNDKGKEKAQPLPVEVKCQACGKSINWRSQKVHAHPRLNVITCQHCHRVWHTGRFDKFEMSENSYGNEIYCSLCGDGGDIILCDHCDKSFCASCIARISGKEHLRYLQEEESAEFRCYLCDSTPIQEMQELCVELTGYFSRNKGKGRVGLRSNGQRLGVVLSNGEGVVDGGTGSGDSGGQKGDRGRRGDHRRGGGSKDGGGGQGGGGGSGQRNRAGSIGSFNHSDSSSQSEGESPVVHSDDVSLSDSSQQENTSAKPDKLKRLQKKTKNEKLSSSDTEKPEAEDKKSQGKETEQQKKKKRRRRINFGDYGSSLSEDEDSSGSVRVRRKPKRKKTSGSSTDTDANLNVSRKKSRLAASLSSNSDDNYNALEVELSGNDLGDSDRGTIQATPTKASSSVQYRIMKPCLDSSSDSEPVVPKSRKRKAESSSGGEEGEKKSDNNLGGVSEKKETKKKRGRKKVINISSDEDDFIGRSLSVRTHRFKRRKMDRLLSSDSDDSNAPFETDLKPKKEEDEGEGEENKEEEEDELNTSFTGKKRKKIRKVFGDAKLASETKQAKEQEKERVARVKELKARGGLGEGSEEEQRLVLERDSDTKKVKLEVRKSLIPHIKPHQREGIKFLYEACVESIKRLKDGHGTGAILAHCMGLGKTLQVIAFADALMMCEESGVKKVLVLCPVNTVNNWKLEFFKWIPFKHCDYNVHILSEATANARLNRLRRWYQGGGLIFMGYEMFRNLALSKRGKKKNREEFSKYLLNPGPDMIVCDEGHVMRNSKSTLSVVVNQVRTRLRVVLTGTPLQNNLQEYYTMVNFVKPNLLGTPREFKNQFVNPITNGQCRDSSPFDIRKMRYQAHVLYRLLADTVQRRDFRILAKTLPPKQEYVVSIRLSSIQDQLYRRYLNKSGNTYMASDLFSTFSTLAKVWNHPWVLKLDEQRKLEREEREALLRSEDEEEEDATLGGFIVLSDDSGSEGRTSRSTSSTSAPANEASKLGPVLISSDEEELPRITIKSEPKPEPKSEPKPAKDEVTPAGGGSTGTTSEPKPERSNSRSPPPWYDDLVGEGCEEQLDLSGKLLFLLELLEQTKSLKEKVLVFSQSLLTLDLIEEFLSKPQFGDWVPALDYYRLDGSTNADLRTANMSAFNKEGNDRLRLFLISTRAGSLGVNLVAANRVVIFDACWNPSHDLQAIFRAYRYGQTKPVFVYRLLAKGTMEEKIYDRQVTKQSLSMRVVDEKQIGRHYSSSDLAELFTYSPPPPPEQASSDKPPERPEEDLVLCRILEKMQPAWVIGYHEHDSLLEHIDDEELSEEERKAAWASYNQQMSVENARYNMQALHERLQASTTGLQAIPTPMGPAAVAPNPAPPFSASAVASAIAAANRVNVAALSQNPIALFHEFQKQSESTIKHVKNLKQTTDNLNHLRQHFHKLPKVDQDRVMGLDAQKQVGYGVLGEKIKLVNELMTAIRFSPLGNDTNFMSVLERQRVTLYNELEGLRQMSAASAPIGGGPPVGGAPPLSHVPSSLGNASVQPNRAIMNANPPNPHLRNQPTPPLGGTNQVNSQSRQGKTSSSNGHQDEVSSTTPDPTTRS